MTRTFFSLQQPWVPTVIALLNLVLTALGSFLLYKPFGISGIVAATAIATSASVIAQGLILRRELNGLEIGSLIDGTLRIALGSAALAGVTYVVWAALESALGQDTLAQILAVGVGAARRGARLPRRGARAARARGTADPRPGSPSLGAAAAGSRLGAGRRGAGAEPVPCEHSPGAARCSTVVGPPAGIAAAHG